LAECNNCPTKDNCNSQEGCTIENNPNNNVKRIIAVMSGKGGVGKSTISALLAKTLKKKGYEVGVLDADITGPSIPRLLQVKDKKVANSEFGLLPALSDEKISVMSLNLLMENEEQPVIWRGPLIAGAVKQFWTDVYWGDLDYLVIDMPPGTGDVALTVMQSIPINGMVMVSTPQDMVSMIVAKSINMARALKIPVLGVVENMSYVRCPDCGKRIRIFGDDNLEENLERLDLQLLGELPMDRKIADLTKEDAKAFEDEVSNEIFSITNKIINTID